MQDLDKNTINTNKSELWNLSFRDLFFKYVRFLPLFVVSVALALLAAFMYLRYAVPVYGVGGTMLIKSEQTGGRSDKFEEMFVNDKAQNIQSEIEILKSKPLMQRVVTSLNLQFTYFVVGKIKTVNIYKQSPFWIEALQITDSSRSFTTTVKYLNSNEISINGGAATSFGKTFQNANGIFRIHKVPGASNSTEYNVIWKPVMAAAATYAGTISVLPKTPGTGILNVSMKTDNSYMGADIVNKLMEQYSNYSIEQKKLSSDQILSFIDARLEDYGRKLDSVQTMYRDYQVKNNLINSEIQTGSYFENIAESDKTTNQQTIQFNVAGMIDDYLADKRNEYGKIVVPSSLGLEDQTLNELVGAYNKAQLKIHFSNQ